MKNRIIKNNLEITGILEDVEEVIKYLKSEKNNFDFNKIIPLTKDSDDLAMDDYMNAALNLYMLKSQNINRANFISTMEFVGLTREYPYNFREITQNELNIYKTKYRVKDLLESADDFMSKVVKKSIFNGYMIRETNWGTGTQPINVKISANRISFITYGNPAENIISKVSELFPNVKIIYTYAYENKENNKIKEIINQVAYRAGEREVRKESEFIPVDTYRLVSKNVTI